MLPKQKIKTSFFDLTVIMDVMKIEHGTFGSFSGVVRISIILDRTRTKISPSTSYFLQNFIHINQGNVITEIITDFSKIG